MSGRAGATTKPTKTGPKRDNNEGSSRLRKDGAYEARVSLPNGQRKSFYGKTRVEVGRKLTKALRVLDQGVPVSTDRQTLAQYLAAWLRNVVAPRVRATTLERYRLDVARVTAKLGHLRLTQVNSQQVQGFLNELSATGLSPATVRHTRAVLRSALEQAEL